MPDSASDAIVTSMILTLDIVMMTLGGLENNFSSFASVIDSPSQMVYIKRFLTFSNVNDQHIGSYGKWKGPPPCGPALRG